MAYSLQPHGLQPIRLLCQRDFPGKDTGVGCHFLLQVIFPAQDQSQQRSSEFWEPAAEGRQSAGHKSTGLKKRFKARNWKGQIFSQGQIQVIRLAMDSKASGEQTTTVAWDKALTKPWPHYPAYLPSPLPCQPQLYSGNACFVKLWIKRSLGSLGG